MQDARADADVALLCSPPQRTTGFSFGYNCGYGALSIWLGNRGLVGLPASPGLAGRLMCHVLSPLAVAAIKANLPQASHSFAPAIWLVCLGGISVFGAIGLGLYDPRLNRKHVGRLE